MAWRRFAVSITEDF